MRRLVPAQMFTIFKIGYSGKGDRINMENDSQTKKSPQKKLLKEIV